MSEITDLGSVPRHLSAPDRNIPTQGHLQATPMTVPARTRAQVR